MQRNTSSKAKTKKGGAQANQQIVNLNLGEVQKKLSKKEHDLLHRKMHDLQETNRTAERKAKKRQGRTLSKPVSKKSKKKKSNEVRDRQILRARILEYKKLLERLPASQRTADVADIPDRLLNPTSHSMTLELISWLDKAIAEIRRRLARQTVTSGSQGPSPGGDGTRLSAFGSTSSRPSGIISPSYPFSSTFYTGFGVPSTFRQTTNRTSQTTGDAEEITVAQNRNFTTVFGALRQNISPTDTIFKIIVLDVPTYRAATFIKIGDEVMRMVDNREDREEPTLVNSYANINVQRGQRGTSPTSHAYDDRLFSTEVPPGDRDPFIPGGRVPRPRDGSVPDDRTGPIIEEIDDAGRPVNRLPAITAPPVYDGTVAVAQPPDDRQSQILENMNELHQNLIRFVRGIRGINAMLPSSISRPINQAIEGFERGDRYVQNILSFINRFRQDGIDVRDVAINNRTRVMSLLMYLGNRFLSIPLPGISAPSRAIAARLTPDPEYNVDGDNYQSMLAIEGRKPTKTMPTNRPISDYFGSRPPATPTTPEQGGIASQVPIDDIPSTPYTPSTPQDQGTSVLPPDTNQRPNEPLQVLPIDYEVFIFDQEGDIISREFPKNTSLDVVDAYKNTLNSPEVFLRPIISSQDLNRLGLSEIRGREYPSSPEETLSDRIRNDIERLGLQRMTGVATAPLPDHETIEPIPHPACPYKESGHIMLVNRLAGGNRPRCIREGDNPKDAREVWDLKGLPPPRDKDPVMQQVFFEDEGGLPTKGFTGQDFDVGGSTGSNVLSAKDLDQEKKEDLIDSALTVGGAAVQVFEVGYIAGKVARAFNQLRNAAKAGRSAFAAAEAAETEVSKDIRLTASGIWEATENTPAAIDTARWLNEAERIAALDTQSKWAKFARKLRNTAYEVSQFKYRPMPYLTVGANLQSAISDYEREIEDYKREIDELQDANQAMDDADNAKELEDVVLVVEEYASSLRQIDPTDYNEDDLQEIINAVSSGLLRIETEFNTIQPQISASNDPVMNTLKDRYLAAINSSRSEVNRLDSAVKQSQQSDKQSQQSDPVLVMP